MIEFYAVGDVDTESITFLLDEFSGVENLSEAVYVVYDQTESEVSNLNDYYYWRVLAEDGDPDSKFKLVIKNDKTFPNIPSNHITDYTTLNTGSFYLVSKEELGILKNLSDRVDLIRKRLPTPGSIINDTDGVGDGGVVGFSGGYFKKFTIGELLRFIQGTLIEINLQPPTTSFWWRFLKDEADKVFNPYQREGHGGIPFRLTELVSEGSVLRALYAWEMLEIDISSVSSSSGLSITYDRSSKVGGLTSKLVSNYINNKKLYKMDFVNSYGVGVGTYYFGVGGVFGRMLGMIEQAGTIPMNSMLGFGAAQNRSL